jgi:hypothetical protein
MVVFAASGPTVPSLKIAVAPPGRHVHLAAAAEMLNRTKAQRLAGESIREIGILTGVFGPLDAYRVNRRCKE